MKKLINISRLTLIVLLGFTFNAFAQDIDNPFKVEKFGKGSKMILFIPGFASSGDVWNKTVNYFKNDHTCYMLTMAGFAGVPPQPDPSFNNWKEAIANFITEHKIEKPIIVGHSMGGGLAMALAVDYPELVSKIVVVDGLPCLAALMNPGFESNQQNDCSTAIAQMTAMTDADFNQMQKQYAPQLSSNTDMHDEIVEWATKSDRATFAKMYCDFSNTDLREKISEIRCPALVLLESNFANYKPAIENQFKKMKTATLKYATKGLHFIMFDDPIWYQNQLENFINQ